MKKKNSIVRYTTEAFIDASRKSTTDWTRALRMSAKEIEANATADDDDFTNDPEFWKNAELVYPAPKDKVSLWLDRNVLQHFKKEGRGYQSRINAILRAYVMREAVKHKRKSTH